MICALVPSAAQCRHFPGRNVHESPILEHAVRSSAMTLEIEIGMYEAFAHSQFICGMRTIMTVDSCCT